MPGSNMFIFFILGSAKKKMKLAAGQASHELLGLAILFLA